MLAFAKDITKTDPDHPEESKNSKLKEYMDYQRQIDHEKLIYHSLDHAKTYLQKIIQDHLADEGKISEYLKKAFPVSHRYATSDTLMLILRKLTNAHNTTNNWFRMNHYFSGVVYDAMERFVKIYNRLQRENPDQTAEYGIAKGIEIDFDDWVRLYFHDLDFLIGQKTSYVHFTFQKRNKAIEAFIAKEAEAGKKKGDAAEEARKNFNIEPEAIKILLGTQADHKDLEMFYTSAENPIYEYLYDTNAEEGFMDGETLMDHSYFLGFQLKGLSEAEADKTLNEIENYSKN